MKDNEARKVLEIIVAILYRGGKINKETMKSMMEYYKNKGKL